MAMLGGLRRCFPPPRSAVLCKVSIASERVHGWSSVETEPTRNSDELKAPSASPSTLHDDGCAVKQVGGRACTGRWAHALPVGLKQRRAPEDVKTKVLDVIRPHVHAGQILAAV